MFFENLSNIFSKKNCLYNFFCFRLKSSETYAKKILWSALFEGGGGGGGLQIVNQE